MEAIFQQLIQLVQTQQNKLTTIASKLEQIESIGGGGGGTASIEDYRSGQTYTRNMLVVDPETETVYRALREYTSVSITADVENGDLKIVGAESQVVSFSHNPTSSEIDNLSDGTLVAVYSPTDTPYTPDT